MSEFCELERERRRRAVARNAGCHALEGYRASPAQQALLKRYIQGELEIEDMLEIVRREAALKHSTLKNRNELPILDRPWGSS